MIIDGHEDIAFNAMLGRDFLRSADQTRALETQSNPEMGLATLGLPDLLQANVRIVFSTIWVGPCEEGKKATEPCYNTPEEAHAIAKQQLEYYRKLTHTAPVTLVGTRIELDRVLVDEEPRLGLVLLMEGADPIVTPKQVHDWFKDGLRIFGLSWGATRYAGGTDKPGPMTPAGRELLGEMERPGFILDLSHTAEASFFEALDVYHGPVIASHSNCRTYVPTDRHLSDEMIHALVNHDGVIGVVLYNAFLQAGWKEAGKVKSRVSLTDVVRHVRHICDLAGDTLHVAIGSDFDGGFGAESIPAELDHVKDLHKLENAFLAAKFSDDDVENILNENWLRVLRRALPT
jgi:membrane dipeptidase